jgi:DNA-binding beta-propeller fold protein YncE
MFSASQRINRISPLCSLPLPPVVLAHRTNDIAAGIAVSRDGKTLYVAGNLSNRLLEIEAASGRILRSWPVGVAPLDVVLAGRKIYVSNWGGRQPGAASPTGPAGQGTRVRVDARGIACEGSVSIIDLARGAEAAVPREIGLGPHACALALSPNQTLAGVRQRRQRPVEHH